MLVKWFIGELGKVLFLLDWVRPASPAIAFTIKLVFLKDFSIGKFCKDVIARRGTRAIRRAGGPHARPNLSARIFVKVSGVFI